MNSYGNLFRISTFGESHGPAIRLLSNIDGCPAGLAIDEHFIQSELDRRKPGQSKITTQRKEDDTFKILFGRIWRQKHRHSHCHCDRKSGSAQQDYSHIRIPSGHPMPIIPTRLNAATATIVVAAEVRLVKLRRVAAGAIAKVASQTIWVDISAFVSQVGEIKAGHYTQPRSHQNRR